MQNFDYAINLYHPEKDKEFGAYEWWYLDAHLDNGYIILITFGAPTLFSEKYTEALIAQQKGTLTAYNPLDLAQVLFNITDADGNLIYEANNPVPVDQIRMETTRLDVSFGKNRLYSRETSDFPEFIVELDNTDASGNAAKAKFVFNPTLPGTCIGRGTCMDTHMNGKHVYHKTVVLAPTAKVKADITITDPRGQETVIRQTGLGYHDRNWGNDFPALTVKGWIWTRIADKDLTLYFAIVPNEVNYPVYTPCFIAFKNKMITSTEAVEFIKEKSSSAEHGYTVAATVKFLEESGVTGDLKFYDMEQIFQMGTYRQFKGNYALDIETKTERITQRGSMLFEDVDFSPLIV